MRTDLLLNVLLPPLQLPHPAIGDARRMMVPRGDAQAAIMLQALTNHNPDIIVVDELSHGGDVRAVRSICQRGVALVATAHAGSLAALLSNVDLNPLVGGIHEVILGDQALRASRYGGGPPGHRGAFARSYESKTRQERRGPPMFKYVVELRRRGEWRIHWDVAASVDALLEGGVPEVEDRALVGGVLYSDGVTGRLRRA
jgi:hypothetical protein